MKTILSPCSTFASIWRIEQMHGFISPPCTFWVYKLIVLQVCNQTKRNRLVYTSTSETVEIRVLPGGHGKETRPKHFLLHYERKHWTITW